MGKETLSWPWGLMPILATFKRQKQEDCCKLEDSLGYTVSPKQKPFLPIIKEILF